MGKYLDNYAEAGKRANRRFRREKDFEIPVVAEEFYEDTKDRVNVRVKHEEDRKIFNVPVMQPSAGDGYGMSPELHLPEPGMLTVPDVPMEELREDSDFIDQLDKQRDHVAEDGYFTPGLRYDDQEAVESEPGDHDYQHKDGYRERYAEGGGHYEQHPSGHTVRTDEGGTLIASPGDEQLCYVGSDGLMMASATFDEYGGDEAGSDSEWTENPVESGAINWDAYCTAEIDESGCTFSAPDGDGGRSTQVVTPEGIGAAYPAEDGEAGYRIDEDSCLVQFPTDDGNCILEIDDEQVRCQTPGAELYLEDDEFRCVNESGSEILADGEDVACISPNGASIGCFGEEMEATDAEGNSVACTGDSVTCESAEGHSMTVDEDGISCETADGTEFSVEDGEISAETPDGGELTVSDDVDIPTLSSEVVTNGQYRERIVTLSIDEGGRINPDVANVFDLTLEDDVRLTVADIDHEYAESVQVVLRQDDTGGHEVEWDDDIYWTDGDPHEMTSDAGTRDSIALFCVNGDWHAVISGLDMQQD
jgi:hypothetical protein